MESVPHGVEQAREEQQMEQAVDRTQQSMKGDEAQRSEVISSRQERLHPREKMVPEQGAEPQHQKHACAEKNDAAVCLLT